MNVHELIQKISGFAPDTPVRIKSLDYSSSVYSIIDIKAVIGDDSQVTLEPDV